MPYFAMMYRVDARGECHCGKLLWVKDGCGHVVLSEFLDVLSGKVPMTSRALSSGLHDERDRVG